MGLGQEFTEKTSIFKLQSRSQKLRKFLRCKINFLCLICVQTSESAFVKRSAASMLSGKRPVQAAVRLNLLACN